MSGVGRATPRGVPAANGFSLIELLVVVLFVGVLAQIAIPNYEIMRDKARAAEILGRIDVVQLAAAEYRESRFRWPAETPSGAVPPELSADLPDDFFTSGRGYELDWENVPLPGGVPADPTLTRLVGVGVTTDDEDLAEQLVQLYGASGWYVVGDTYVFLYRDV